MGWLADILPMFKRDKVSEFRAITEAQRMFNDQMSRDLKIARGRIFELEKESREQWNTIRKLQEYEEDCQRGMIKLLQDYRDVKEELIFLKKGRNL